MGYTHYWDFVDNCSLYDFSTAIADCTKIIKASPVPLGNWDGEGEPTLTEYASTVKEVHFNGSKDDSHEDFKVSLQSFRNKGNWFCKTAQKPYDIVVVACLCVLEDRLGKNFQARSDGAPHEWEDGKNLAFEVLGRDIKIPQNVIDQVNMKDDYVKQYRKDHPEYNYINRPFLG